MEVLLLLASVWSAERCLPHLWALVDLPVFSSSLGIKESPDGDRAAVRALQAERRRHHEGGDGEGILSRSAVGVAI